MSSTIIHDGQPVAQSGPQRSAEAPLPSKPLLQILYEQLSEKVGPSPDGSQILTLQCPTRYLDKNEFQFELSGIHSESSKPAVVSEAEFRLTDALYDASTIVGGPNGRNLGTVYREILDSFVPKVSNRSRERESKVKAERERMRAWLLTDIGHQNEYDASGKAMGGSSDMEKARSSFLPSKTETPRKMTRMEFSSDMNKAYLDAQKRWELERDDIKANQTMTGDPKQLLKATRKVVHSTQPEDGQLAKKHADALSASAARGYSHNVREALGYLDMPSAAEILQDAKDAFQSAARSSLYRSSKAYPVSMSPFDWAVALDTTFAPEDLSKDPNTIINKDRQSAGSTSAGHLVMNDLVINNPAAAGGSRWQEIHITHDLKPSHPYSEADVKSSSDSWNVKLWLAGAGGSSERKRGHAQDHTQENNFQLDISLKVTRVTVDRSSWFQPKLVGSSEGYMRNNASMSPTGYDKGTAETIAKEIRELHHLKRRSPNQLPAYPVGYVICKDVFIKVSGMQMSSTAEKTHVLEDFQSSGGSLCFRYDPTNGKSQNGSQAAFEMASDGMIVRIPGPQILGYIQQIVPEHESSQHDSDLSQAREF